MKKNIKGYKGEAWEDIAEKFAQKEIQVFGVNVSSIDTYLVNKYAFQEIGDLVGYSNTEGKPWYRMFMNHVYAINSASQQKEGAWRFMEFLLSEEYQSIHTKNFPVRVDAFEALLDKKVEFNENDVFHSMVLNIQVKASELPEFEEADKEFLRFMADHAYWEESVSVQEVSSILCEELAPFFLGDKSAEETAEIIQNRISLYLKE